MTAEMAKENSFGTAFYALINSEQDTALHSIREKAFRVFQENGLPTVGNEDWKYLFMPLKTREEDE